MLYCLDASYENSEHLLWFMSLKKTAGSRFILEEQGMGTVLTAPDCGHQPIYRLTISLLCMFMALHSGK